MLECDWFLPKMSLEQAHQLKGYDMVTVDPEVVFNNRESLDALRADNPKIKILCYFNCNEWFFPMFPDKPWSMNIVDYLDKQEEWFLHGKDDQRLTFWVDEISGKKTYTMNCRIDCPKVSVYSADKKISYVEFIAQRLIDDVLKSYSFDGVEWDNLWPEIHWLGMYKTNKSGMKYESLPDNDSISLNMRWRDGINYAINEVKKFGGENFLIIGNPGNLSFGKINGKKVEGFPEYYLNEADTVYHAWFESMNTASVFSPGPCIFNARAENYFFTICSVMLLDNVYFSYLQNTKYESKYELGLGSPMALSQIEKGVATRRYENGTVFVNPALEKAWINYNTGEIRDQ
ncbi:MAG: putative glycoside hydrolase [bacterium]|nr:putative glycoside hydrolase [bacterium]